MTDALIKVSEPAVADKNVDTESLTGAGGATVQRERIQIAGVALAEVAKVTNGTPGGADYGVVTRPAALPLPTGAATAALQTQPGVDIGDVTINNGVAGGAVNVQDGGNSLTVDGTFWQATQPVSGPLTDAQLRAVAVPVSGTVTATGPLTDAQLRATAVPVSGVVSTKTDLAPAAPSATSVGVASAQAVAANANRKGLILVNTSTNRISLGFGSAAVLDSGITLYTGGVYVMEEYDFDLGAVNAIASAAASNLGIQEYS